ncbi:hypothetical protein [Streptomyces ardesiacus]|uniref:Uncharacterized protein n=1 Tax=Streptomyces ardesiacus TaxID=285564 RepID=A0ABW8HCC2_9ACTN
MPGWQIVMPDPQDPDRENKFAVVWGLEVPRARLRVPEPGECCVRLRASDDGPDAPAAQDL